MAHMFSDDPILCLGWSSPFFTEVIQKNAGSLNSGVGAPGQNFLAFFTALDDLLMCL